MESLYKVGSEVFWNDPDDESCSRNDTVKFVVSVSSDGNTVYRLSSGVEVFEHELE